MYKRFEQKERDLLIGAEDRPILKDGGNTGWSKTKEPPEPEMDPIEPPVEEMMDYFIPARALEHRENGENFNLHRKIVWALLRFEQQGDFLGSFDLRYDTPSVYIKSIKFNKERLGYDVEARVKSG